MAAQQLLLFGDQTVETLASIQNLFRCSNTSLPLRTFLRDAADIVQTYTATLDVVYRQRFFGFDTLLDLAEGYGKQDVVGHLPSTILTYTARFGELVLYAEENPHILDSHSHDVHVLGVCTGLLPAAAAVCARNMNELLALGKKILCISFRLGMEIARRSERIESEPGCWAYIVTGISPGGCQDAIDSFHKDSNILKHRYAFISVICGGYVTVSGPPATLIKLFQTTDLLNSASKLPLPVSVAVHAPHLPIPDVDIIIGNTISSSQKLSKSCLLSNHTAKPYHADNLRSLLSLVIDDILQNVLYLSDLVDATIARLHRGCDVILTCLGPTNQTQLVQTSCAAAGYKVIITNHADPPLPTQVREGSGCIAIVGMSGRFPRADNVHAYWKNLLEGAELHEKIPGNRFDIESYFDAEGRKKNSTNAPYGCFITSPGLFDPHLFNVSPREAAQMDPLQRILLMTTYEALQSAGYSRDGSISTDSKRVATFIGQSTDDWREINRINGIDMYYVPATIRAFAPGRLNHYFKWEGPAYSVDTACTSSASAITLACSALIARECDTAVAGGGNILNSPETYSGLSRGGFLSTTGACKTFRHDADGYCRGEGVAVVILKRLEDAFAENDTIHAVIRGFAKNHSAWAESITHPHPETQQRLHAKLLRRSSVKPHEISYVEMHGTATQVGDVAEMTSVTNVLAQGRLSDNPLYLGAVKANIGHGEAAAGVTSLIKTVMMLKEKVIPPQPGVEKGLNPKYPPLDRMNVRIPTKPVALRPSPVGDGKVRVLLNSFDAAGGNTSLLLEDAPAPPTKSEDPRSYHVVACSARTLYSLRMNQQGLLDFLASVTDVKLADLAYTTTARRIHDVFRAAYPARTVDHLMQQLRADLAAKSSPKRTMSKRSIVFLCTGQGSQYAGMGCDLFNQSSIFKESITISQAICHSLGLPSFVHLIENAEINIESQTPAVVQLANVALSIALADLWRSWGISPDLIIGHSLGEYAALHIAGVLSANDVFYLVGSRAKALQERCTPGTHAMLAVSGSLEALKQELNKPEFGKCQIACRNSPNMHVVSAKTEIIRVFQSHLQSRGFRTKLLKVQHGFHSEQIEPILPDIEMLAKRVHFAKPRIPIASTLLGSIVENSSDFGPTYLARQSREEVKFTEALEAARFSGIVNENTIWVEVGPEPVCLDLVRDSLQIPAARLLPSIKKGDPCFKTLAISLAMGYNVGVNIDWTKIHHEYRNALSLLELPTYSFDMKDYWSPYIKSDSATYIAKAPEAVSVPGFPTTCLQMVVSESFTANETIVNFCSRTSNLKFFETVQGHIVNGVPICPASMFWEMGCTAATYMYARRHPANPVPTISIHDLQITSPLKVFVPDESHLVEVTATATAMTDWSVTVLFKSRNRSDAQKHGSCRITYGNGNSWKMRFSKISYFVKTRADDLIGLALSGNVHRILKPMVYRLFTNVVKYNEKYRGIKEVYLAADCNEAVANVGISSAFKQGQSAYDATTTDSLVQVAGFVLNGNPNCSEDTVYLCEGFKHLTIDDVMSATTVYQCYSRMEEKSKGLYTGDLYVFDDARIFAVCEGIIFRKMKRNVLGAILSNGTSQTSHPATPNSNPFRRQTLRKSSLSEIPFILHPQETEQPGSDTSLSLKEIGISTPASSIDNTNVGDIADIFLAVLATETGMNPCDIDPSSMFADLGVDSMMSIAILDTVKRSTGLWLPATFFQDYPTVADAQKKFQSSSQLNNADLSSNVIEEVVNGVRHRQYEKSPRDISKVMDDTVNPSNSSSVAAANEDVKYASVLPFSVTVESVLGNSISSHYTSPNGDKLRGESKSLEKYFSNIMLIQGQPKSGKTPIFLLVDGAGSASAYIHLPIFASGAPVYALESPFLKCPLEYNCSIPEIAAIFLRSLQSVQSRGPYILGGWSAGGAYAYEVSRLLLGQGERILGLLLIDIRVPRPMPDLECNAELIEQTGLVIGIRRSGKSMPKEISERLEQHLVSTCRALCVYEPVPMNKNSCPERTIIIWATQGMKEMRDLTGKDWEDLQDAMRDVMKDPLPGILPWFYANRASFGPNGWDELLGGNIECHTIDADHFSMMVRPAVNKLGQILQQSVEKFLVQI